MRDATEDDVLAISALYNALIGTTTIAWTETPETIDERLAWFGQQQRRGHPVLVADVGGEVVGFASFGDFRDTSKWPGYRFVVEQTVHVRADRWGEGIGRRLVLDLVDRARAAGKTQIIGGVDAENVSSIHFHERLGFVEVARLPRIGFKFGRWLDLVLMQRSTERSD